MLGKSNSLWHFFLQNTWSKFSGDISGEKDQETGKHNKTYTLTQDLEGSKGRKCSTLHLGIVLNMQNSVRLDVLGNTVVI